MNTTGPRAALGWLAGRWFRQRWLAAVPLALIVAVGGAGTMIAVGAAERTSSAYGDYLQRAEVGDLVINPSLNTRQIGEVIRDLPNVERVTSDTMLFATFDDGRRRPRFEVEETDYQSFTFGSYDGRYFEMDRPIVVEGRMPSGPNEAAATVESAAIDGFAVGDVVPVSFWAATISDGLSPAAAEQFWLEEISPIGTEQVEVVGIIRLSDEVLPDQLYPRARVLVSPDLAARYDCLPDEPPAGISLAEAAAQMLPDDCAVNYRYYSIEFADGTAGVKPALDQFVQRSGEMNAKFETYTGVLTGELPNYFTITVETDRERQRIERANRPIVTAAMVLAIAAALVTLVLYGLAVAREIRRTAAERRQWHRLGVDPVSVGTAVLGPIAAATVIGLLVAGVAGWLFDPGPMGLVSVVEPHAARRLTGAALGALAAVTALALVLAVVLVARAVRRPERFEVGLTGVERPRRVPIPIGSPVVSESVRAAYGQRAAPPVLAGIMLLTASLTAALVFGASLERLLDDSRSYGWPWDVAAMAGAGYGDLDVDRLQAELGNHPAVADWTVLGFVNELALDGEPLMSMIMYDGMSDVDVTVLDGELPRHADEIAIGEQTAAERGLSVGDTVEVGIYSVRSTATITGLIVFPALGPMLSDRVGGGNGMAIPQAFFETPDLAWLTADAMSLTSFVGVKTVTDDPSAIEAIEQRLVTLDLQGAPAATFTEPIRPAEIIDAGSTRNVPVTLAIVLAVVGAVGVAFAAWASIRARRKELSVLRTLGFSDLQVRGSVVLQSVATVLAALVVGGPVGVIGGRLLWRAFADQLGVLPDPASPTVPVLIAAVGGIAVACLAAQLPAVLATRALPAQGLRTE